MMLVRLCDEETGGKTRWKDKAAEQRGEPDGRNEPPQCFIPDTASVCCDGWESLQVNTQLSKAEGRTEGHPMLLSQCYYLTRRDR